MVGYICKYTPTELFNYFNIETKKLNPGAKNTILADALMHPNVCSYVKVILEEMLDNKYEAIILPSCCDSVKRLCDVLNDKKVKVYFLDVPRKVNEASIKIFAKNLIVLKDSLEKDTGVKFYYNKLIDILLSMKEAKYAETAETAHKNQNVNLAIVGARINEEIKNAICECGVTLREDLTCTGYGRDFSSFKDALSEEEFFIEYAKALLLQFPCMRMEKTEARTEKLKESKIQGIIYNTVKFCDTYSYEYSCLKEELDIPMLKIETDYNNKNSGQLKTRIEAFIETLGKKSESKDEDKTPLKNESKKGKYVLGIDSGSTSTNAVIMDFNEKLINYSVVNTGANALKGAEEAKRLVLEKASLYESDIAYTIATGYGRVSLSFADNTVTEITCHGKGSHYLNGDVRTIIDIGGQDSKAIRLNENGDVIDFAMNDKCAAGTGRFLDSMSKTLEIPLSDMGNRSLEYKNKVSITSMCTVFAESEVVSLVAKNIPLPDILNGINTSISTRVVSLVDRIGRRSGFMMTGGVAKNCGVVKTLEEKLKEKIYIPEEPQIVGALGAALIALGTVNKK